MYFEKFKKMDDFWQFCTLKNDLPVQHQSAASWHEYNLSNIVKKWLKSTKFWQFFEKKYLEILIPKMDRSWLVQKYQKNSIFFEILGHFLKKIVKISQILAIFREENSPFLFYNFRNFELFCPFHENIYLNSRC